LEPPGALTGFEGSVFMMLMHSVCVRGGEQGALCCSRLVAATGVRPALQESSAEEVEGV
jgi:hypothetical protein